MGQITKVVQEMGNGGHIYLPKEMVGQRVVITLAEKSIEEIEDEILVLLKPHLRHIKGIYLHGSYARGEQTPESDIDILVITDGKIRIKRMNKYEIMSMTQEQMEKTLEHAAVLILPILKEARVIFNGELIDRYRNEKLTKKNTKWYIDTTESSLKLAEDWISDKDARSLPSIVYPLIMRLRGLYMIESLVYNRRYSNKELNKYLMKNGLSADKVDKLNRIYREERDSKRISPHSLEYNDVFKLYNIVYEYFSKVKLLWAKLR